MAAEKVLDPDIAELQRLREELMADPEKWAENQKRWAHMHDKMQSSVPDPEDNSRPDEAVERVE